MMGILGAFVFTAQMINFTIPGTGSSGHLGGGLLLAILLGPYAAFLTIASVLVIQALFFADGGLLALGANIFNLGVFPCFLAYPFIFKPIAGTGARNPGPGRIILAALPAAIIGLLAGALGVVLETVFSGITSLPFKSFVLLMLPVHLAIGIVEGLVTAAVVIFVFKTDPGLIFVFSKKSQSPKAFWRPALIGLMLVALVTGVALSWFASTHPDGLEWSIARVTGSEELQGPEQGMHGVLSRLQKKFAPLPDYGFRIGSEGAKTESVDAESTWPAVNAGTSVSGILGGLLTLALVVLAGILLRKGFIHSPISRK